MDAENRETRDVETLECGDWVSNIRVVETLECGDWVSNIRVVEFLEGDEVFVDVSVVERIEREDPFLDKVEAVEDAVGDVIDLATGGILNPVTWFKWAYKVKKWLKL